jgi:hypothetical protein
MADGYDSDAAVSGGHGRDPEDLPASPTLEDLQVIEQAVVVEVIDDPSLMSEARLTLVGASYQGVDSAFLATAKSAPRNSVIAILTTAGSGRTSALGVYYPFFSSHVCLPCKPGEKVWVIFPDPANKKGQGYWLSRVNAPLYAEDANYTHYDRTLGPITPEQAEVFRGKDNKPIDAPNPGFPNGLGQHVGVGPDPPVTLPGISAYDKIVARAAENKRFIVEPVPRLTKRPGDLVLQGSHNSTIILGTSRGYKSDETDAKITGASSNAALLDSKGNSKKLPPGKGSMDLVVGRGRLLVLDESKGPKKGFGLDGIASKDGTTIESKWPQGQGLKLQRPPGKKPKRTQPEVVQNSRTGYETNKNPSLLNSEISNRNVNVSEGDPDFLADASRVYLTMDSDADKDFALVYPKVPGAGESNEGKEINKKKDDPPINAAAVVTKADEIRIIARQIEPKKTGGGEDGINGSIKIVKEGLADNEEGKGRACIIMQPDGVIMIDGPKVVIGSGIEKENGKGSQLSIGLGATEPLVLGNELDKRLVQVCDVIEAVIKQLDSTNQELATHTHPTGVGPSGPPVNPAPFSAAIPQELRKILEGPNDRKDLKSLREDIVLIKSKVGKTK